MYEQRLKMDITASGVHGLMEWSIANKEYLKR
jgi:hypothetical protein